MTKTMLTTGCALLLIAAPACNSDSLGPDLGSGQDLAGQVSPDLGTQPDLAPPADLAGVQLYALDVSATGAGSGTIQVNGGACALPCATQLPAGSSVTLTAAASAGSSVGAWTAPCAGSTNSCSFALNADATLSLAFDLLPTYSLTVTKTSIAGGSGTVSASGGAIACGLTCSASYPSDAMVTLTATPATGARFLRWSGDCAGSATTCVVATTAARNVTAIFGPSANIVFVTSALYTLSTITGLAAADAACAARATAGGLPGTYVAWLSTSTVDAKTRLGSARGWVRVDGLPFADSVASLTSGVTWYPADLDELGALQNTFALTGTHSDGTANAPFTCADYTNSGGSALIGATLSGTGGAWTEYSGGSCTSFNLYCFGTDQSAVVSAPASSARKAFLSVAAFVPSSLAAADTICASEATAAGLSGIYQAFLNPTDTGNGADRFDTSLGPWARPDGVLIVKSGADLAGSPSNWLAVPNLNADGSVSSAPFRWRGSGSNCQNWTSSSVSDTGSMMLNRSPSYGASECNSTTIRLLCLQK